MNTDESIVQALDRYLLDPPRISSPDFDGLYSDWAELHQKQASRPPFSHPAWFGTWLNHFGEGVSPLLLAVRRDDRLIGVVPLVFGGRDATLLGDSNVFDYAGVCMEGGEEAAVIASALEWLMADFCQSLSVWGVREASTLGLALAAAGRRFGWNVSCEEEAVSPVAELPDDWDAYLAGLRKKDRHELRRKLRNLEAAANVELVESTSAAGVERAVDQLLVMMRASREDKSEFLTPAMEAFFRELGPAFARLGLVRLSTLLLDGAAAATVFAFEDEHTVYLYNSGYDPEYAGLAVGLLSKALVLRNAVESGKTAFDFLRGDERYKFHLGGEGRLVERFVLRRPA
jgi:CelD/BcsL family acetyltransferase involved in cellulose biosynthesis